MKTKKISFGVVGVGHIGKRHSNMILNNQNCELISFCDIKDKKDLNLSQFKGIPFYNNLDDMLSHLSLIHI